MRCESGVRDRVHRLAVLRPDAGQGHRARGTRAAAATPARRSLRRSRFHGVATNRDLAGGDARVAGLPCGRDDARTSSSATTPPALPRAGLAADRAPDRGCAVACTPPRGRRRWPASRRAVGATSAAYRRPQAEFGTRDGGGDASRSTISLPAPPSRSPWTKWQPRAAAARPDPARGHRDGAGRPRRHCAVHVATARRHRTGVSERWYAEPAGESDPGCLHAAPCTTSPPRADRTGAGDRHRGRGRGSGDRWPRADAGPARGDEDGASDQPPTPTAW